MRNHILFVPGNGCRAQEDYPKTWAALEDAGFTLSEVVPPWGQPFAEIAKHVTEDMARQIGHSTIVLSHSHGSNLALPTVIKQTEAAAIIASPSTLCATGYADPFARAYAERAFPDQADTILPFADTSSYTGARIAPQHTAVLVGEQEIAKWPFMETIAVAIAAQLGTTATRVANAHHFIDHSQSYIEAVVQAAQHLQNTT